MEVGFRREKLITKDEQLGEIAVAKVSDIPDGGMLQVMVEQLPVLLCRLQEKVFAIGALCPHRGAPLQEGQLSGAFIRCPWHGTRFDVRTGMRVCAPECVDARVYSVVVKEEQIWLSFSGMKEL